MSNQAERQAEDAYEAKNDDVGDFPRATKGDNDAGYLRTENRQKDDPVPIVSEQEGDAELDNAEPANSDAQLAQDDKDAISKDNILKETTRGAKPMGSYSEGPDEDETFPTQ